MRESLRYVVLLHEGFGDTHYDLMFETTAGSELLTWRCAEWPLRTGLILKPLALHRRAYLEYEGPLSNNRGRVRRVAWGQYELSTNRDGLFQGVFSDQTEFTLTTDGPDRWFCAIV